MDLWARFNGRALTTILQFVDNNNNHKNKMSFIDVRQLNRLIASNRGEDTLESTVLRFQKNYQMGLSFEDLLGLAETATRINKREKTKGDQAKPKSKIQAYEIFSFGQLKVFKWALVLYSHKHQKDLPQYSSCDIDALQAIFKRKTRLFIHYHLQEIISSNTKPSQEWTHDQLELLRQIVEHFGVQSDWKAVSFELFRRSSGAVFKTFAACREKWNSHINPRIKKTEWTLAEDVELFSLISQYGCRWALISRELKGIRSEHTVKNRYNALVKSVRKQIRLGDTKDVNSRILKILKANLQKGSKRADQLNISGYSSNSKGSRQRSREEERQHLNLSQSSEDQNQKEQQIQNQGSLFAGIYDQHNLSDYSHDLLLSQPQESSLKQAYFELKKEKKTNDQDQDENKEKQMIDQEFPELEKNAFGCEVKTLTLEQLQREYDRLMNFDADSNEPNLYYLDELDQLDHGVNPVKNYWMQGVEDINYRWCKFNE